MRGKRACRMRVPGFFKQALANVNFAALCRGGEGRTRMSEINNLWLLVCGCFVFFMQAGFACYEVGFVRPKNVISVAMENIVALVVATLTFFFIGFALMFGKSCAGLFGTTHWLLTGLKGGGDYIFVFYEMMLAATSITIFSGSMSERTKMKALVIASAVVGGIIYPVFGHWVWGGYYLHQSTFLSRLGYMDYAGATVVHSTAGWIALAGVIAVGPRKDRWDKEGKPARLGRSNIPFAALGTFILWFGWFGFNGGGLLEFREKLGLILLNTNLAASTGVVGAVATTYFFAKKQSLMESIFSGALGGLVAITAGSDILRPVQSLFVGLITGAVMTMGSVLLQKLKIDDAVNAIPIHAFGGVCGAVLCALFASPEYLPLGSRLRQVGVQMLGVGVNFAWSFGAGLLMFLLIKKTVGLRVLDEEEEKGLNIVEFSDVYSWLQYLKEEQYENVTQGLSERVRRQNIILKRQANMLAETQEKERETIARNLHDGVGQSLVALKINLGLLQKGTEDKKLKQQAETTMELAQDTIDGIRDVIYDLRPVQLTKDGLANSIRTLCEKFQKISPADIHCSVASDLTEWNETEEVNLYRIVQECLTNILKHAEATRVELDMLKINPGTVLIRISDNGKGFDVNRVSSGFGLTTIHDRAAMLNARLMINSEIGSGTRIILEVPYGQN